MNPDGSEHMDAVDLLLKLAVFGCFVVFGITLWLYKRQKEKQKSSGSENAKPPRIPDA